MADMQPSAAAKALGRKGGRARAARLSADERIAIASLGGKARSLSFHAARRIRDNFRYAAALEGLRGRRPAVTRMRNFEGRLPGLVRKIKSQRR
jgi:hypothetical protein